MNKEELDGILETAYRHLVKDINYKETRTRYEQAAAAIRALIKKPQAKLVTEEWIEEKAKELITKVANLYPREASPCVIPRNTAKDFIRKLVKEIRRVA